MANTIGEGDRNLVRLDYTSLLTSILEALKNPQSKNPYRISENGKHLHLEIDEIAYNLATTQDNQIQMPLSSWQGMKVATTNFTESSKDSFVKLNREIRDCLQQHLKSSLSDRNFNSIEQFLPTFWTSLTEFQLEHNSKQGENEANKISLEYDFEKKYQGLSKQRLTLKHDDNDNPLLKFHRLTISIKDTKDKFDLQLRESIENYIKRQFDTNNNKDELEEILEDLYTYRDDIDSDWYAIKRLMDTEAIAKVQRTAKIKYLEYLLEHIGEHSDAIHLEILIHRLKELERYIDDPNRTDGDYQVSYNSESFNIKEIFCWANAFDRLPIIPIINGSLGESRDDNKGELNFTFGLKLKLGGEIQTEGAKTVLEYNLDLLDPDSKKQQEELANQSKKVFCVRRTIQIAVLYFFVFAGNDPEDINYNINFDLDHDVISEFEKDILPKLKSSDDSIKKKLFKKIIQDINRQKTEGKISKLKELLKTQIKKSQIWSSRIYPIQINVKQGVLETEANSIDERNTFFRDGLTKKTALKYISVNDANIDTSSVCYLSGNIKISEIGYFDTRDNQAFSMEYLTGKFPTIPIVLYALETETNRKKIIDQKFRVRNLIIFSYNQTRLKQNIFNGDNPRSVFIYQFVFSLLSYICLKIILDTATYKLNCRLFIPILRLHLGNKENPLEEEVFFRSNFASISHHFNFEHRSNTQGISLKNFNSFKIKNALSSLYNVLPKKFTLNNNPSNPKINKLAIIVVSSRECDRSWQGKYKIANLTGEVIKLDRQNDGSILVYTSKTISNHYDIDQLYNDPDIIVDEVNQLYEKGYRHILYIAKSPYSQTLNLTATEEEGNLYFMSSPVIRNLKGNKEDLKIYPVFFDKYFVVSLQTIKRKSLYIQDAEELTNIVEDPSKKVAVFFNLFNGIQVGKSEDHYYNGVISYSTLLNVYDQNLLDTGEIYADLINNDHEQGLKTEILQLLTLFHFSRYEKDEKYAKNIQLKLDPYQMRKLIDNIGVISYQHREIVKQWATFFLQKSFLAGLNFLDEYFSAIGWNSNRKLRRLEVVYFQGYFADDNTLGTYPKGKNRVYQDWLSQFKNQGIDINNIDTNKYQKEGEFLNADSLIYFRYKHQVRILAIDYSIFTVRSIRDLTDLNNIEVLRQILLSNISYLKSKSVFANLGIDSKSDRFLFSESLSQYYKAFARKDKETIKMIQAGSYAYSFWNWLTSQQQILAEDEVTFNIIGYSDRDSASLCLQQENIELLKTCHHIYRQKSIVSEISSAREKVLSIIKRKAKRSFASGQKFIDDLLEISSDGIHLVSHQETFTDFNSYLDTIPLDLAEQLGVSPSLNLQQTHAELIQRVLSSIDDSLYVFLTGNPGIGKTTAISNFLKQEKILEEGFLFIYVCPRTQVNLETLEKFTDSETKRLCDDRLITINTNSTLIGKNEGKATVQYCSNQLEHRFTLQTVDFIPQDESIEFSSGNSQSVVRKTATRLQESGSSRKGVLYSMSEAIYSLINDGHNNIVATVALQSLKKLSGGKDTLNHFQRIFRDIYNETEAKPIEAKLQQLSQRVKHIFIAVDEITGDRSGVDFLLGVSQQLKQYRLTNRNYFNTKIIVADASIIDADVIKQHLSDTTAEPNKIFFRKAPKIDVCLTVESFTFNKAQAVALNTNSYPARQLHITYKTLVHSLKFQERNKKVYRTKKYELEQHAQIEIAKDIENITVTVILPTKTI